jgi:hypothetical protein
MCDICGWMLCPPSCPSYDGRDAERGMSLGRCAVCGRFLYEDSDFFVEGTKITCAKCLPRATRRSTWDVNNVDISRMLIAKGEK